MGKKNARNLIWIAELGPNEKLVLLAMIEKGEYVSESKLCEMTGLDRFSLKKILSDLPSEEQLLRVLGKWGEEL